MPEKTAQQEEAEKILENASAYANQLLRAKNQARGRLGQQSKTNAQERQARQARNLELSNLRQNTGVREAQESNQVNNLENETQAAVNRQRSENGARQRQAAQRLIDQQIADGIDPKVLKYAEIDDVLKEVAKDLRRQIEDGDFKSFVYVLFLAAIKDTLDIFAGIFSLGILNAVSSVIFGPLFWYIFWISRFAVFKKMKRRLRRQLTMQAWRIIIIMFLSESTPIIGMAPMTVFGVLWLKYDADQARKKLEGEIQEVGQVLKEI